MPLSTTSPGKVMPYHHKLIIDPVLPEPYNAPFHWAKADMLYTVSFARLFLVSNGKDNQGRRLYIVRVIEREDFIKIQECVLHGLGLGALTKR